MLSGAVDATRKAPAHRIVQVDVDDRMIVEQPPNLGTHDHAFADGCVDDLVRGVVCAYRQEAPRHVLGQFTDLKRALPGSTADEDRTRRMVRRGGRLMNKGQQQQLLAFIGIFEADAARKARVCRGDMALRADTRELFIGQLEEWLKRSVVEADKLERVHGGSAWTEVSACWRTRTWRARHFRTCDSFRGQPTCPLHPLGGVRACLIESSDARLFDAILDCHHENVQVNVLQRLELDAVSGDMRVADGMCVLLIQVMLVVDAHDVDG